MFLSSAIPSAIRMVSGFGFSFCPLFSSVLYSVVLTRCVARLRPTHTFAEHYPVTYPPNPNEKAALAAAHSFETEPVSQEALRGSSGNPPEKHQARSGIQFPARRRWPRPWSMLLLMQLHGWARWSCS